MSQKILAKHILALKGSEQLIRFSQLSNQKKNYLLIIPTEMSSFRL